MVNKPKSQCDYYNQNQTSLEDIVQSKDGVNDCKLLPI